MSAVPRHLSAGTVFLAWVAANTLGSCAGILAIGALRSVGGDLQLHIGLALIESAAVFLLPGLLIGTTQWLVLRQLFARVGWWVASTTVGTLGGAMALAAIFGISVGQAGQETGAGFIVAAAAGGCVLGAAQWFVMRRCIPNACWWVWGSAIATCLGVVLFAFASRDGVLGVLGTAAAGAIGGAAYGVMTGFVLLFLLRKLYASPAPLGLRLP